MKKVLLTFLILFITVVSANAAKSTGEAHAFSQPDGTTLMVRLLGDEDFSWYQTMDGVLLKCVNKTFYIAKTMSDGTLESTGIIAHNLDSRKADEAAAAKVQDKTLFFTERNNTASMAKARRKSIAGYPANYYCPHSGTVRVPIILMEFAKTDSNDVKFTFTDKAVWEEYFNGTTKTPYTSATRFQGYGSVAQYFKDASNGKLNFVFDIYGPYTAANGHDYYGKNKGYTRELSLLKEAVALADGDINFAQYDSNNDNRVDMVYIVYAGTGANTSGDNSDFWPACWSTSGSFASADGMKINVIGGANEVVDITIKDVKTRYKAGIGVTCHEMSHGMGMPDLYAYSSFTDYNNNGPEDWDLMDGGENLYRSMWPCQYTAWEKDMMGWIQLQELSQPTDITIAPLNATGENAKAYKIKNPANEYEYYVIENYQGDEWNYYLSEIYSLGKGIIVTHVNATDKGLDMKCNDTYKHPNLTLLPADNFIMAMQSIGYTCMYKGTTQTITGQMYLTELKGDPYCGTKYTGTPITSVSAFKNYAPYHFMSDDNGDLINTYHISNIARNEDGSMTFRFSVVGDVNKDGKINMADVSDVIYQLSKDETSGGEGIIDVNYDDSAADINNDGTVDLQDINLLVNKILQR